MTRAEARDALRSLRGARRAHVVEDVHFVDTLYKGYVTAIMVFLAALGIAKVLGDSKLTGTALHDAQTYGTAWVGLLIAAVFALALRSGARGGPLAPEPADVAHVLLAPVPRRSVMTGMAARQLRGVVLIGVSTGTAIGLAVGPRMGGSYAAWILSCIAAGIATALGAWGLAAVASGRRWSLLVATGLGVVLIAWSIFDIATHLTTSPGSAVAAIGFLPAHRSAAAAVGVVGVLAVVLIAFTGLGGVALESAQRRAALVGQLRFAATVQDMRAILVLQRQLAAVPLRSTPYLRLRAPRPGAMRRVGWHRSWRSILRFPPSRVLRHVALALLIGASCVAIVHGTAALVFVAGVLAWLLGNDVIEPFAQELDHPDIGRGVPQVRGRLLFHLLWAPAVYLAGLGVLGIITAVVLRPGSGTLEIALAITPLAVGCALTAAALTVMLGSVATSRLQSVGLPELQGLLLIARQGGPPLLATLGMAPIAVATALTRFVDTHHTKAAANMRGSIPGITLATAAFAAMGIAAVLYYVASRKDTVE